MEGPYNFENLVADFSRLTLSDPPLELVPNA